MLCLSGFELYSRWVPLLCVLQSKKGQEQAQSTRSIKLTCQRHFNFLNFEQVAVLMGVNYKRSYCLGFHVKCGLWPWSWVTRHLRFFFIRKCMAVLPDRKKVAVITRCPYYRGGQLIRQIRVDGLKRSLHGSHSMLCYIAKVCVLFFSHAAGYRSPRQAPDSTETLYLQAKANQYYSQWSTRSAYHRKGNFQLLSDERLSCRTELLPCG